MKRPSVILALMAGFLVPAGLAHSVRAQDADLAAVNARVSALDAEDYPFVQPVCTHCHTPEMFLHSRSWSGWKGIFDQMSGYGATATPEQWDHIHKYFQHSLTLIDVNHADEDELSAVLGVDEKTAIAIVQRRTDRRFQSAAELEAMPGVNKDRIEAVAPRLLFDRPPGDR